MRAADHSRSELISQNVEAFCLRQGFFPCRRLLIALSGGADSVTLLHLMHSLQSKYGFELFAMHINHMIRGEDADRDEAFCASFCKSLGVPLHSVRIDIPTLAKAEQKGLEECARDHRYASLEAYADAISADCIATAHTATDQIETVLMQLIRGSVTAGGIPPRRGRLIRPLLERSRSEILAYVGENGLDFVEDSSNSDDRFTRNFIRHKILPSIQALNPRAEEAFCRFASQRREECDFLSEEAMRRLNGCILPDALPLSLPLADLQALDHTLLGYALARLCERYGIKGLGHIHFEAMKRLITEGRASASLSLPSGIVCYVEADRFVLRAANESKPSPNRSAAIDPFILKIGENRLPDGAILFAYTEMNGSVEKYIKEKQNIYKLFINTALDFGKIGNVIRVRSRQPGDRIFSGGMHRKVKKHFCDLHIPLEKRAFQPILCDDDGILWIPAMKTARDGTVAEKSAAQALHLIYMGEE